MALDVICTDLLQSLDRLRGKIDILLFNPPYVPTSMEEYIQSIDRKSNEHDILSQAWAGGPIGRCVLDRLMPQVNEYLSKNGLFYIVVVEENNPQEISKIMSSYGFTSEVREIIILN